jgi:hypothetical protein
VIDLLNRLEIEGPGAWRHHGSLKPGGAGHPQLSGLVLEVIAYGSLRSAVGSKPENICSFLGTSPLLNDVHRTPLQSFEFTRSSNDAAHLAPPGFRKGSPKRRTPFGSRP